MSNIGLLVRKFICASKDLYSFIKQQDIAGPECKIISDGVSRLYSSDVYSHFAIVIMVDYKYNYTHNMQTKRICKVQKSTILSVRQDQFEERILTTNVHSASHF